jgi:hypothetical protein
MERAHGGANATPTAAAATVAPLLKLKRAAEKAEKLARLSRAVELYERAIAAAELRGAAARLACQRRAAP